jgi:hypothetical protein
MVAGEDYNYTTVKVTRMLLNFALNEINSLDVR